MTEKRKKESKDLKEIKRLSIISDILILIPVIIATVLVIKAFDIPVLEEESKEVLSLEAQTQTISEENEYYIKKIKEEFGITVLFGKDIESFAKRVDATPLYNENIINNNIKIIYKSLKKYPSNVFDMTKTKENLLYIMLIDSFENNNLALASRNNLEEYRIYISNAEKLERAFHHEMYHILEYYMTKNGNTLYSNWNEFNPEDFEYNEDTSKLTKEYVYDKEQKKLTDCFFLTRYSKATEKEDRAEIFAEIMTLKESEEYLNKECFVRKKIDLIAETLNTKFTINEFYFSKYLK